MPHDVFISYSTKNATVADAVCAGLERRGIGCWIAPRDIEPGQDWPSAIISAIDTCKVFVIIVSVASSASDEVMRELQNAASAGVPILPLRIEDVKLSPGMRYYLGTPHWLDALTKPLDEHIGRLADTVSRVLGRDMHEHAGSEEAAVPGAEAAAVPERPTPAPMATVQVRAEATAAPMPRERGPSAIILPQPIPDDRPWEKAGTEVGEEIVGPDGGVYVWVPPGSFMMGSEEGRDNERPVHRVELDGFWMGKYEVTNAQYAGFCEGNGRVFSPDRGHGTDHPVVWVHWHIAKDYCDQYGLSLPTEAQWEYAAAGPESRTYPWGHEWDHEKLCWNGNRGPHGKTFPVGSFPDGASWCGALDMAGNVWEWCADWYSREYYRLSPEHNPPGPETGSERVLRGGSWSNDDENYFRCAYRHNNNPDLPVRQLRVSVRQDRAVITACGRCRFTALPLAPLVCAVRGE